VEASAKLTQEQLRMVFEARLQRDLTDKEFALLVRLGNGLFWDYQGGLIGPYDLPTLQSGKQLLDRLDSARL
jgi:hypothetical protein